jgi:hypothetical protein
MSPVPPLGTRRRGRGGGGVGEDDGQLDGATRRAAVVGGLGGCLDPVATGPYGGSRVTREEKTARRRNRGPTQPPAQARWKKIGVLRLGFIPNRHERRKTKRPSSHQIRHW